MADLARLHLFILRRLSSSGNCNVFPACDLLAGKKDASLAAFSSWGTVHGYNASYTRMSLSLIDCHFGKTPPAAPVLQARPPQHQKRPRAESSTSCESGSESGQPIPALSSFRTSERQPSLRGFTRGGTRGSGTGNPFPRGFKRGNFIGGRGK
jgi:hypothetical protein